MRLRRRIITALLAGFATILLAGTTYWMSNRWHNDYPSEYNAILDTNAFTILDSRSPSTTIIATLDYLYYPYFGSRRQFDVHRPRRIKSEAALYQYLSACHADVVSVIRKDPHVFGRYKNCGDWIFNNPDVFIPIAHGADFDVYSVQRDRLEDLLSTGSRAGGNLKVGDAPSPSGTIPSALPNR